TSARGADGCRPRGARNRARGRRAPDAAPPTIRTGYRLNMGFFDKIKASLARTKQQFVERFDDIVRRAEEPERRGRTVDVETIDALGEALISADVGVAAADQIISAVRDKRARAEALRPLVKAEILSILKAADRPVPPGSPHVVLIVGVNGTGKTTTVGKLARLIKDSGKTPLICAADTFR